MQIAWILAGLRARNGTSRPFVAGFPSRAHCDMTQGILGCARRLGVSGGRTYRQGSHARRRGWSSGASATACLLLDAFSNVAPALLTMPSAQGLARAPVLGGDCPASRDSFHHTSEFRDLLDLGKCRNFEKSRSRGCAGVGPPWRDPLRRTIPAGPITAASAHPISQRCRSHVRELVRAMKEESSRGGVADDPSGRPLLGGPLDRILVNATQMSESDQRGPRRPAAALGSSIKSPPEVVPTRLANGGVKREAAFVNPRLTNLLAIRSIAISALASEHTPAGTHKLGQLAPLVGAGRGSGILTRFLLRPNDLGPAQCVRHGLTAESAWCAAA